jgi:hypothetical protein
LREAGLVHDLHDLIDIVVSLGLLFRQTAVTLAAGDDPLGLQPLVNAAATSTSPPRLLPSALTAGQETKNKREMKDLRRAWKHASPEERQEIR